MRGTAAALLASLVLLVSGAAAQNPSSANNPFYGSVTLHPATGNVIRLSLDDAIHRGLDTNLGLKEAEAGELALKGEKNEALQAFLPSISLSGGTSVHEYNLAALGFGPGTISKFSALFPGGFPTNLSLITKADVTQGQINFSQTLFSGPVIAAWKGAKAAEKVAYFTKMTARGNVVQQVATSYLHVLAAQSEVDNRIAQERADQVALDNAHAAHEAGIVAGLDELRARVELQAQQQVRIAAENEREKTLILLKREIGIAPGQKVQLTDPTPYSDLAEQTPEEVLAMAYKNRQDYQNLINQVEELKAVHSAYRAQRLPSLKFRGYWGTDTVNGAGTHGTFAAVGTLSVPIFREADIRGNEDASQAQLDAARNELADLREHMNQQVRSALLDAHSASQLVAVARSNADLARQALSDETERVKAGVDNNLPLVTAQASLASAEANLVESLFQYNLAKLNLARAAGVIELQYRQYLGN
ncbi:MAG: TolC family protein [Acidobacteriota bacterium]|nr:TolC family protein [Acidobacteriota bacterium]